MFSLGVLLWQISSGKIPFEDQDNNVLFITIMSGSRKEKTPRIPDTPNEYYNLYNECWNKEPEKRHAIEYIYDTLENLLKGDDEKIEQIEDVGGDEVKAGDVENYDSEGKLL